MITARCAAKAGALSASIRNFGQPAKPHQNNRASACAGLTAGLEQELLEKFAEAGVQNGNTKA